MQQDRWKRIKWAREVLGLPEQVTRIEIQEAYHKMSRKAHPDLGKGDKEMMEDVNKAYRLLMDYVDKYKIRLTPNEDGMTDQEWWMHHFGQDPIWGGGSGED